MEFWQEVTLSIAALVGGLTTALLMLRFATRSVCFYRLEGVQEEGNVVEKCDHCNTRRVYYCQPDQRIRLVQYSDREWREGRPGTEVIDGKI